MAALLAVAAAALGLTACGGDGDGGDDSARACVDRPAAASADAFPAGGDQSLEELVGELPEGPILAPSTSVYDPGRTNRVTFATLDVGHEQVCGAQVAVYLLDRRLRAARGPYLARPESLEVRPQYRSRQSAGDLAAIDSVHVAQVPIPRRGSYVIAGIARLDGRTVATSQFSIRASSPAGLPRTGDRAPRVTTQTVGDVAGDLASIDTRLPPVPELHADNAADVIGRRPVVLLFATPQLCASRVCGPVADVLYQVSADRANAGVSFIHQEIYNGNRVDRGLRPQVRRYGLTTEPWAFAIDRRGIVRARIEGAFGAAELQAAVDRIR